MLHYKKSEVTKPEVRLEYRNCVHESAQSFKNPQNADSAWTEIKTCLLNTCNTVCGLTRGGKPKRKETWWWNDAQEDKFGNLKSNDQRNQIFKEARRMKNENQDNVGEKCIKDNDGNLAFDDKSKINCLERSLRKAS